MRVQRERRGVVPVVCVRRESGCVGDGRVFEGCTGSCVRQMGIYLKFGGQVSRGEECKLCTAGAAADIGKRLSCSTVGRRLRSVDGEVACGCLGF